MNGKRKGLGYVKDEEFEENKNIRLEEKEIDTP